MAQRTRVTALLSAALLAMTGVGALVASSAQAAAGCKVDYAVTNQWGEGFGANVTLTNLGDPIDGWTVGWTYASGQRITTAWNGTATQSGSAVSVKSLSYNGSLRTGGTTSFGFNGTWSGSNPVPTKFTVNGVTCTGFGHGHAHADADGDTDTHADADGDAHADADDHHRAHGHDPARHQRAAARLRRQPVQPVRQADPAARREHARPAVVLRLLQHELAGHARQRLEGRRPADRDVRERGRLRHRPVRLHVEGEQPRRPGGVARHVLDHRLPHAHAG